MTAYKKQQTSDVKLAFDLLARQHQLFVEGLERDFYTQQIQRLVLPYLLSSDRDMPILDVGCGHGYWGNWVNQYGYKVQALDLSQKMLSLAKKNFPDIDFLQMDIQKLGVIENQYRFILAIGDVLSYVDIRQALGELIRIARQGAVIVGTVISTGGVLVKEVSQCNYTAILGLLQNGLWMERSAEELQNAVSCKENQDMPITALYAKTYTCSVLKEVFQELPLEILTIQGLNVWKRLGGGEIDINNKEQIEIENELAANNTWMDISTNLFFAVRVSKQ